MNIYLILSVSNPSILWALLFLAIPVIIHLFNFRRVKKVEFSNIALLKKVKEESSAKRKPVELLILLSRILFMTFLILAFAQPINKDTENNLELSDQVLIYVDNSWSMTTPIEARQSGLDLAFSFADRIVDAYPEDAKFRLLENGYQNALSVSYSKSTIKDRLTELEVSGVSRSIDEIKNRIGASNFRGDVYLISDFQKNSGLDPSAFQSDTLRNYYFVPVQYDANANVYIDSVSLENTFLLDGLRNVLNVQVTNDSREESRDVNLKLYLSDQLTATTNLNIPGNGSVSESFEIDRNAAGLDNVVVTVDDSPVFFDNSYYLTLNNVEKVNVVEIRENNSLDYIDKLYDGNELFNFEVFNSGNIDLNQLAQADFIILNELSSISNQLAAAINNFLQGNGAVLVIPGSAGGAIYSAIGISFQPDTGQRLRLSNPNFENPFFEGIFEESVENINMPNASTDLRLRNSELSILGFQNGRSFLSKVATPGNLYAFSCSIDDSRTGFATHSLFVPVMYKLALGSRANLNRLYHYTDDEVIVYPLVAGTNSAEIFTLVNNENAITPDQRINGDNLILTIPKDQIVAGHYQLMSGADVVGTLAFNNPKSESDLSTYSVAELQEALVGEHLYVMDVDDGLSVERELTAGIKGVGLWKYALMLSLLFLFVEIILIRYL